jgi:hypothetical protein
MSSRHNFISLALIVVAASAGCGGSNVIVVNGIEVYEKYWNRAVSDITPRATFEMQCPQQQLQFVLMRRDGRHPSEIAVTGCSKRALYARSIIRVGWGAAASSSWVLSSASWQVPAPPAAAPAPGAAPAPAAPAPAAPASTEPAPQPAPAAATPPAT